MNTQSESFLADSAADWAAVGKPHPHESAILHVSGEANYTDDLPELQGTLHAALGLSQKAHAHVRGMDLERVRAAPGVVAVLTASDIPGVNDCGPLIHDDPNFADGLVQYVGQPLFMVVADSHDNARRAVRAARVDYDELPAVASIEAAIAPDAPKIWDAAASNVLFGSLQTITAQQIGVSPVLMASANTVGGVMGKMIDAQSIVVASTATGYFGHESAILRRVFWHSLALASLVGVLVFLQAYVWPFTAMVVR